MRRIWRFRGKKRELNVRNIELACSCWIFAVSLKPYCEEKILWRSPVKSPGFILQIFIKKKTGVNRKGTNYLGRHPFSRKSILEPFFPSKLPNFLGVERFFTKLLSRTIPFIARTQASPLSDNLRVTLLQLLGLEPTSSCFQGKWFSKNNLLLETTLVLC